MLIATEEDEKLDLERAKERFLDGTLNTEAQIISLAAETSMDIVTTPTQPQLNSTVVFDTKMTLHFPPPPNVCNISVVIVPILTKL